MKLQIEQPKQVLNDGNSIFQFLNIPFFMSVIFKTMDFVLKSVLFLIMTLHKLNKLLGLKTNSRFKLFS